MCGNWVGVSPHLEVVAGEAYWKDKLDYQEGHGLSNFLLCKNFNQILLTRPGIKNIQ